MTRLTRLPAALAPALFLTACGGHGAPPQAACRTVPTTIRVDDPRAIDGYPSTPLPVTVRCTFDVAAATLLCSAPFEDAAGARWIQTRRRVYPSVAAFVDEGATVGAVRAIDDAPVPAPDAPSGPERLIPRRPVEGRVAYAEDGRALSAGTTQFVGWDPALRPTLARPTPICTGDPGARWTYDDARRQVVHAFATRTLTPSPDGTVPCIARAVDYRFDGSGNVSSVDGIEYRTVEATRVCVPPS